jgi:MobA-like NTP transferase domain
MTTTVLLIASGHSLRLGRDKPTLRLGSESLLQRHLRQARAVGADRAIIVANAENRSGILADLGETDAGRVQVCVRHSGPDAQDAIRDGLALLGDTDALLIGGITDLVPDDTHGQLVDVGFGIAIPTVRLTEPFVGGMLEIVGDRVRRIVEKPPGGCPPGAMVNVWIHHIAGAELVRTVVDLTVRLGHYQRAVNDLINRGVLVTAVPVWPWRSIKTADDVMVAQRLFDLAVAP